MQNQHPKPALNPALSFVLFTLLFSIGCIFAATVLFVVSPNTNGLGSIFLSVMCATPLAYVLFFNSKFISKVKPYQRYLLPALIIPLFSGLLLGWTLFQQRPENIFKVFVADPIPDGVSNIQAYDISVGIDQEIVVAVSATPEAIDDIITKNELELVVDTISLEDPPYEYFPNINKDTDWIMYRNSHKVNKTVFISMWVNPERSIVIFRYIYG
jgi:hypothetical protein